MRKNRTQGLYRQAKRLIPGGTQLFSKRPELFLPNFWPAYYSKAKGCQIWDLDGNKYIDMSNMGVGSCILGYADRDVNQAVKLVIDNGNMSTLNAPEEVELASILLKIHPWAQMVRYARSGGEAMAIAVRIARAFSRKDIVLFCGYHGWHDWYLAANLAGKRSLDGHLLPGLTPLGVPRQLRGTSIPFTYNDIEGFLKLIKKYKNKIGVVAVETIRNHYPQKGFLETIRKITSDLNIALIFDEISSGWRLNWGGAHLIFDIYPDIAVFAKAISNGLPMAAIIGRKKVMSVASSTFISSTYWTDRIGPAAALATIKKLKIKNVSKHLSDIGKQVQDGWRRLSLEHNLDIDISGIYPLGHFSFKHKNYAALKTIFTQSMLKNGFLATTSFYASYAHKQRHVNAYLKTVDETFAFISKVKNKNNIHKYLKGPLCQSGFARLT